MTTNPTATALPFGSIDIHSHLLYGVDDGCQTLEQTIECINHLKQAGYVASICTPHIVPDKFPDNTPASLLPKFQKMQQELRDAGVDYPLFMGGEVTSRPYTVEWFKENGVPTLAGSRYVLMDVWGTDWHDWLNPLMQWVIDQGYTPILAHPERFKGGHGQMHRFIELKQMGVMLQGNLPCLMGKYGPEIEAVARELLLQNHYDLMATDSHNPNGTLAAIQGREVFSTLQCPASLDQKTSGLPRKILGLA